MPEVRTTNLRFNLGKEPQRKAWQYLQTMDKSVFKSYSQVVATAVVDYFDRYQQCAAVRPIIAVEREQALLNESRVDDAAIQLAEQLVDAKNKYSYNKANQRSTVRSRTDRAR